MKRTAIVTAALLGVLAVAGCYSPYHGYYRGDRYYDRSYHDREWRRDHDRDRYRDDWRYR